MRTGIFSEALAIVRYPFGEHRKAWFSSNMPWRRCLNLLLPHKSRKQVTNCLPSLLSSLLFASPTYTPIIISHSVSPFLSLSKFVCVHLRFAFSHHHRHPSSPASYFSHTSTVAVFAKTKQKPKLNLLEKWAHKTISRCAYLRGSFARWQQQQQQNERKIKLCTKSRNAIAFSRNSRDVIST